MTPASAMRSFWARTTVLGGLAFCLFHPGVVAVADVVQAPALAGAAQRISAADRVYTGDQSSNTITVIKPLTGEVLGTIALGDPRLSDVIGPQYTRVVNSHGLGFSRDGRLLVSLSVTSNTVTVIRCADNGVVSRTSVDRNAHEAFFAPDNRTVWVGTRGVDHIDLVDGIEGGVVGRVPSPGGPSKVLFSPDGREAYANHIRAAAVSVIDVARREVVANITGLADVFSSDMMLSADGRRLWVAHKMVGKVSVVSVRQRRVLGSLDTGPETNHPNFAEVLVRGNGNGNGNGNGTTMTLGFVTVAALNRTRVYAQPDPEVMPGAQPFAEIAASGIEPHGLWPSPDNTRMYVVNEHSDTVDVVDLTADPFRVVQTLNVGQEGQALVYVAGAVPDGAGPGAQDLGRQGLVGRPALNRILTSEPSGERGGEHGNKTTPTALVTVRPQQGLEMFQVIGRNLKLNTTYTISGECQGCNGAQVPLVDFSASMPTSGGCGTAPQVLAFFKFDGVYSLESLRLFEAKGP